MDKAEFATVFCTFGDLASVKVTLPTVIAETARAGARLLVHDCSTREVGRDEKWTWLRELSAQHDFFLFLSSPMSMAASRNFAMHFAIQQWLPEYVCLMEDDHGFREGFIPLMTESIRRHYGKKAPNGFHFGMFSGCTHHWGVPSATLPDGGIYPTGDNGAMRLGGTNSCLRCAPTHHWLEVLKGYDLDDYPISCFQTGPSVLRNYHRGFTAMIVGGGEYVFTMDRAGRGVTDEANFALWGNDFAARDPRAIFDRERVYRVHPHLKPPMGQGPA